MLSIIVIGTSSMLYAFKIPSTWNNSVIAIGIETYDLNKLNGQIESKKDLSGAGVLVKTDRFVLVTAKHVVFDKNGKLLPNLCFWGNRIDGTEFKRSFNELQKEYPNIRWVAHPDPEIDIAAAIVGLKPWEENVAFVTLSDFENIINVEKGEDIYYLGYPLGFGASYGSDPMVRKGMVSLKEKKDKFFYIDATVAPGNSGGPVFTIQDDRLRFLGIVSQFRWFERGGELFHAGIGVVYPVSYIKELLESKEFKATY